MKAPSQGTGPGSIATLTAHTRSAAHASLLKLACRHCHVTALHKQSMETTSDKGLYANATLWSNQQERLHRKVRMQSMCLTNIHQSTSQLAVAAASGVLCSHQSWSRSWLQIQLHNRKFDASFWCILCICRLCCLSNNWTCSDQCQADRHHVMARCTYITACSCETC